MSRRGERTSPRLVIDVVIRQGQSGQEPQVWAFRSAREELRMDEVGAEPERRVGWGFVVLYTSAYMGTCLVLIAPITVTLALKVNSLVGTERARDSLALVVGVGALMAVVGPRPSWVVRGPAVLQRAVRRAAGGPA
jgi:hypothetical protein